MLSTLVFYVPLGLVGLARWVSWILRRTPAVFYRPYRSQHREPITVVTPVYREDPRVFAAALESWLANKLVVDVICVIHEDDHACREVASRYPVRVLVGTDPRKRQAMRLGWEHATTSLVALADSDTVWASDVSERVCEPFADPRIGAVGTRQNVLWPTTLWHRLNDIYLDYRYFDEIAAQTAFGRAVSCISGRTAVYRREVLQQAADDFISETFLGVPCLSGDDKRLTTLALKHGWRTYLQRTAQCWSALPSTAPTFFKQRLRWARNTWRSDLRALTEGWVFRHPFLAFCMADKAVSPFTQLLSPTYFTLALLRGDWIFALILVTWWLVSRGVKILPHLRQHPRNVVILPAFILLTFVMAVLKIYALVTCRRQGWLTREPSRTPVPEFREPLPARRPLVGAQPVGAGMSRALRVGAVTVVAATAIFTPTVLSQPDASPLPRYSEASGPRPQSGYTGPHPMECLRTTGNSTDCRARQPFAFDPVLMKGITPPEQAMPRAIRLTTTSVELLEHGVSIRRIPFDVLGRWAPLEKIVAAIADPRWIAETAPGLYELRAAFHHEPGTRLLVSGPRVRTVRMLAKPGVFIRGVAAQARFEGVSVTSWVPETRGPDLDTTDGRPFLMYDRGSNLAIRSSTFEYLGSDHANSYGVAWVRGSTGRAERSTFRRNFFGVHLSAVGDVVLRRNTFVESVFYGVNLHSGAARIAIERNTSRGNGAHGYVLAEDVHKTSVVDNRAHNNGGNGVILFQDSTGNHIARNAIEHNLDGVAVVDAGRNVIERNTIVQHRNGVRVQGRASTGNLVRDNVIRGGRDGIRVQGRPAVVQLQRNGISDVSGHGITADALRSSVVGGEVRDGHVGLDLRAGAVVSDVRVDSRHGVIGRPLTNIRLEGVQIVGRASGIRVQKWADIHVKDSFVMAPKPVYALTSRYGVFSDGSLLASSTNNRVVRRPKPVYDWLPRAGLAFVVAAMALELLRRYRGRAESSS